MMRKVAISRKSQTHKSTIENKANFSLIVVDCDFQDTLLILISLNKRET